jgi:integrase
MATVIDNISTLLGDDLKRTLPKSRLKIAALCFSIYAWEALKDELAKVESLEFIFTAPTFTPAAEDGLGRQEHREFFIPKTGRERRLYGSEFEIRLRNKLTQKAIARECAEWIGRKAKFRSNRTTAPMNGFACVAGGANGDAAYLPIRMLDNYCSHTHCTVPTIPDKTLIKGFLDSVSYLTPKSRSNILGMLRQFGLFLSDLHYKPYIPPVQKVPVGEFVPYIYSKNEITRLLAAVRNMKVNLRSPYMHAVLPAIIRMLYGCGLRISEAVNLLTSDVDLDQGILHIRESKFEKDRLIPMSASLISACRQYVQDPAIRSASSLYFFPAPDGGPLSTSTIRERFWVMLTKTGIRRHRDRRPRLHDLRHTFAVHCLRRWAKTGVDVMTALPILATYLGHGDIKATCRYLRLTADVFPEISETMSKAYHEIFPEVANVEAY